MAIDHGRRGIFAALVGVLVWALPDITAAQSVVYEVAFEGEWTTSATPGGVPVGAHFSPLIGAVHNANATLWRSGSTASAGIESMAEVGGTATLEGEITAAGPDALSVIKRASNIDPTETVTLASVTLTDAHPLVTLVTMVAPSPDWFVGVSGLSLMNDQGEWRTSYAVDLFPYDAGTEDGTEFSLGNDPTSPQGTITSIKGTGKFSDEAIATLTFTLRAAPTIVTESPIVVAENETNVATLVAEDSDAEAADLTWSIASGADAGKFTLGAGTGVLAFAAAKDYESPDDADADGTYELTVEVTDGVSTATAELEVKLDNVLELHTAITGQASVGFAENRALRVATYVASSEADRSSVTWTLTGADADKFSIDDPGGALRFDLDPESQNLFPQPPDYEAPADADGDNAYAVTLQASDGVTTSSLAVTVTVSDEDEPGTLNLSATRPRVGTELIGTLADPDVVNGAPAYVWERSAGRNAWAVIDGADSNSYRPTAADAGEFLRATATYRDRHGDGRTAQAVPAEVVTARLLSGLRVTTNDSMAHAARAMRPGAFDPATLHYAIGCADDDTMMLTVSASDAAARLSVGGEQTANRNATVAVPVSGESDVRIEVTDGTGARTTYTVHCLPEDFPEITARKNPNADGVIEELIIVPHGGLLILDNNGVPRFRRFFDRPRTGGFFQFERVGENLDYRYVYSDFVTSSNRYGVFVLDKNFEEIDRATTVTPLAGFDSHDHRLLPDGNYLLMSYEWANRDFSHLPFNDENGNPYGSSLTVRDSAIQLVTPQGDALFTWNSWGKMPLEDCAQHRFPDGYAHINSLQMVDGYIVASMRGCSKVLVLDPNHAQDHKVVWRLGRSNLSDAQWAASEFGPAPLDIVGDPEGEFCGQHAAQIRPNGNLLLYDNGAWCVTSPWTREVLAREGLMHSRAVEYALDLDNNEAVFVRDHSLRGARNRLGHASGNVSVLANGDWLISWGKPALPGDPWGFGPPYSPDEAVTQVDPDTGEEKFFLSAPDGMAQARIKALPMPPEALATVPAALSAVASTSAATSTFHTGALDRPQVVVVFNQPVVDFEKSTPSVRVTGASVDSVAPHIKTGEPANAYLITLAPESHDPIVLGLEIGVACADGGICTAGGARLETVPGAVTIPGPVTVTVLSDAAVTEGESTTVVVSMQPAHGRRGDVELALSALSGSTAVRGSDYDLPASVTFGPADTVRAVSLATATDRLVEGEEEVVLGLESPLPDGVRAGETATVTIEDATSSTLALTVGSDQVAEGNSTVLTFSAGPGIAFTTDQTITFTVGGTAQAGDYIVSAGGVALSTPYSLTLRAGANAVTATLRAVDDGSQEDAETVVFDATHVGSTIGSRTVTIPANDRVFAEISVQSAVSSPMEGTQLAFKLTRAGGSASDELSVAVLVEETGDMLDGVPPAVATFEAGSSAATLTVATTDDGVVEEDSDVTVTVRPSGSDTYDIGNPQSASVTVADNDTATFEVTVVPERIEEGASAAVTIAVAGGVTFSTAQALGIELGGASPADYTVSAGGRTLDAPYGLTLPALASSVTATVNAVDDLDEEGAEALSVAATHGTERIGSGTLTIAASDSPARIGVVAQEAAVDEGEALAFTLTRTRVTEPDDLGPLTVAVAVSDGGGRLSGPGPAPSAVTFARGRSEAQLRLDTNDDRVIAVDADERPVASDAVSVTVVADPDEPPAYVVAEQAGAARVAVLENDVAAFSLTVSPTRVAEGDAVAVSAAVGNGVTFSASQTVTLFAGEAGTAQSGADYGVFAPNQRERDHLRLQQGRDVATGTIRIEDDALSEGAETIRVVAAHAGVTFGAATIVIAANDGHAETRLAPVLEAVTVDGATVVVAYDRPLDEGSTPGAFSVRVDGVDRAVVSVRVEGPEVRLTLASPAAHGEAVAVSYMPGADPIRDTHGNEAAGFADEVAFETLVSLGPAWASEGEALAFPVWLSRAVGGSVPVGWTVEPGSASAGVDYAGATSGTLTLGTGTRAGTIEVTTVEDAGFEPDETFTVRLTEAVGFPAWAGLSDSVATGTIVNDDSAPPTTGGGGGGGGGGGSANRPPVVERPIEDQTLDAGESLELDIRLNFYDRDQRALDYTVESADPSVAEVEVDPDGTLTITGIARGVTAITVTAADRREESVSQTLVVTVGGPALVALVPRAADLMREGFVRVINHSGEGGGIAIEAIDDAGMRAGPITLTLNAGETVHFNSDDLEDGNADKGLAQGVGPGEGDWRLVLDSELDFEVLSYIRTEDGFLTAIHDIVPLIDGSYRVAIFNPGENPNQVSHLRLINPGDGPAAVTVDGIDDAGDSPGDAVTFDVPAGESLTLTASELESGTGLDGALGDGVGKWRLSVRSDKPIVAMSLLSSPTGHLTNLSTMPRTPAEDGAYLVPLFPAASDALGRQGFARVVNRADESGTVLIEAYDDSDFSYPAVTLALDAGQTQHFNSDDLELGNAGKGLTGSTGTGVGDWRLVLSSALDIDVLAYIRTDDGFLTSMHDIAPVLLGERRVAIFNPGSNPNQVSRLRLVNPGTEDAQVTITGVDDAGASPGGAVTVTVPAGASRTIAAADLEAGGEGLTGALGDGTGKWRLALTSEQPIVVMSLLSSPTGHLTNLSTAPDRGC